MIAPPMPFTIEMSVDRVIGVCIRDLIVQAILNGYQYVLLLGGFQSCLCVRMNMTGSIIIMMAEITRVGTRGNIMKWI